jgi:hypothetical protein
MVRKLGLGPTNFVVEVASNDGYLLQYFNEKAVPVLGIEPSGNVAAVAIGKGIETLVAFFGAKLARDLKKVRGGGADLVLGNNVLAHVPDLNDFVSGLRILVADEGVITMEFPHLLNLIRELQFDTIYHEHFSYFSLLTVRTVFEKHDLRIFDVDRLPTHGGSLRIYATPRAGKKWGEEERVQQLLDEEVAAGLNDVAGYSGFSDSIRQIKFDLLSFLIDAKQQGKRVVGYGAPAKGNTLLNFCGIRTDFIDFTVDRSKHKQGLFLPGTRIPIHPPERIFEVKPDYILILPWNLKDEIVKQMAGVSEWGAKFVTPIPALKVLE